MTFAGLSCIRKAGKSTACFLKRTTTGNGKMTVTVWHSSEDWSVPCCIENNVVVDFWGYMAVGNQDDAQFLSEWIAEDGYIGINSSMFSGFPFCGNQEIPMLSPAI